MPIVTRVRRRGLELRSAGDRICRDDRGMTTQLLLPQESVPAGGAVLNPFVIVDDAAGFVDFVSEVFGAPETAEARTPMPNGKLIHAQVRLGTVDLMVADRLDEWPARPGLLQVWVNDPVEVLR